MALIDPVAADLMDKADASCAPPSDIPIPPLPAMSGTRYHFYKFMENLFHQTLCPIPEGRFHCWLYNVTGGIASYFHCKTCDRCKTRFKGWKYTISTWF